MTKKLLVLFSILPFMVSCDKGFSQRVINIIDSRATAFSPEWNLTPDEKNLQQPTATDLLNQSVKAYSNLGSYQDTGTVTSIYSSDHIYIQKLEFHTEFDRTSDRLRFEFWDTPGEFTESHPYVVWKDKAQVKTWWALGDRVETNISIDFALGGASGVSQGVAHMVPYVLTEDFDGNNCAFLMSCSAYRISDIVEDNVGYFRLQVLSHHEASGSGEYASPESSSKETFWIRKDNLLLVRIVGDSVFPKFKNHTITQYQPIINKKIPDSAFTFGH